MPGPPWTPEQTAAVVAEYQRTGNLSAAGRVLDPPAHASSVRHALVRAGLLTTRAKLHARACERVERIGRAAMREHVERLRERLATETDPAVVAPLTRALADCIRVVESLRNSLDKRWTAALEREALRANADAAKREALRGKVGSVLSPSSPEWAALQREVFGEERQGGS